MLAIFIGVKGVGIVLGLVVAALGCGYAFRGKEKKVLSSVGNDVKTQVNKL